jgi:hypothetical protein
VRVYYGTPSPSNSRIRKMTTMRKRIKIRIKIRTGNAAR